MVCILEEAASLVLTSEFNFGEVGRDPDRSGLKGVSPAELENSLLEHGGDFKRNLFSRPTNCMNEVRG